MELKVIDPKPNLTVREIFHIEYVADKFNNAKARVHVVDGIRWVHIHRQRFTTIESALSYLREDGRNIVAPENRKPTLEVEA